MNLNELLNVTKELDLEKVKSALANGLSPNSLFGDECESPLLNIAAKVLQLLPFFK